MPTFREIIEELEKFKSETALRPKTISMTEEEWQVLKDDLMRNWLMYDVKIDGDKPIKIAGVDIKIIR